MSGFKQVAAAVAISVKSIPQRLAMASATVVGVALAVLVLLGFLSMAHGFRQAMDSAGSPDVAILLANGSRSEADSLVTADQYRRLLDAPGIARNAGGPLIAGEAYVVVNAPRRGGGEEANVPLRGTTAQGLAVREGFRLSSGRMFAAGSREIVIGGALQRQLAGFELGATVRLGPGEWTIVGIIDADGSALESEMWGDLSVVQGLFRSDNALQSVRLRPASPAALQAIEAYLRNDPLLKLDLVNEQTFFAGQARGLSQMIRYLGWPLALLMALGALAGALNTLHSSVAARAAEIATLRIIGFGRFATFCGVLAEALLLAAAGAVAGVGLGALLLHDLTSSSVGASMTMMSFRLQLSPEIVGSAVALALTVGLVGGAIAAWRAARQPILEGLAR